MLEPKDGARRSETEDCNRQLRFAAACAEPGQVVRISVEDQPGHYILANSAVVRAGCSLETYIVVDLPGGAHVQVLEVADVAVENRIRGRLEEPEGWITLCDTEHLKRFAWPTLNQDWLGDYILSTYSVVRAGCSLKSAKVADDLATGANVRVLEIVNIADEKRIRGRIEKPAGWITLCDTEHLNRLAWPMLDLMVGRAPS